VDGTNRTENELLEVVCARIADLALPAFVKDSQLRYVAVNAAYARFFGLPVEDFPGHVSSELYDDPDEGTREDRERRVIVFGSEESVPVSERKGLRRHLIDLERFITDDERFYVFGVMERVEEVAESHPVSLPDDLDFIPDVSLLESRVVSQVFDLAEIGVAAFDEGGVLVSCNETFRALYDELPVAVRPGLDILAMFGAIYETLSSTDSRNAAKLAREMWIGGRLSEIDREGSETVDQLVSGRFVRMNGRRLPDDGILLVCSDATRSFEQKIRLREQARTAEIYRAALEGLQVAVFMRDGEGRMTYANEAYGRVLGGDRATFIGKTEKEMFPDAWEQFVRENREVIKTGEPIEKSEEVVFDGEVSLPIITRVSRIEAPDGEPFVVGSITDVSVLKDREVRLLEAQNHAETLRAELAMILASLPVGVMLLDENLRITYANEAYIQTWSPARRGELIGLTYREFVRINFDEGRYLDAGDDFEALYQRRLDTFGSATVAPTEVHTHDGKVLLLYNTALSNGKFLQTNFDITTVRVREREANEAREALEQLGELMHEATGVMSQGLLILRGGFIEMSNAAVCAMLHLPAESLQAGCAWRDVFAMMAERGDFGPPEEAARVKQVWEDNIAAGRSIQSSFLAAGRTWIQLEVNLSGPAHWLAVFTDVTEMKRREEDLTRLLQRAEAADKAKSEFLANMSHEIRTPMNGVLGMAELLAKSDLDARQKTFTDVIVKSGNALMTIINDILDFSKIDAGQMKLRTMPFDPVESIEDVATLLAAGASEKDIELMVRGSGAKRPIVIGDAGRFRQIVTNLVGNAVKFTEKGHVLIDFSFEARADGQQVLSLKIEDTGIGIADDKLRYIFDKFSQADSSNTRRHEGSGLGLSITAGLVDLFGGTVAVASTPGEGSVFRVMLPFAVAGERAAPRNLPANVQGARVMVIDDNAISRGILEDLLTGWGFDACACANGEEGLAVLGAAAEAGLQIDAVLIDYPMTDGQAAAIAQHMRDDLLYADIPVVFLTSMESAGGESLFAALNVRAHLMKPPRADLLRNTVIDVVRAAQLRRGEGVDAADAVVSIPQPSPASPVVAPRSEKAPPRPGVQGLDILVAEDNEVNQIVFTQILQGTNYSFRLVQNGKEAVEVWRTASPSIILMDVSMPVMNGHQATQLIREIEAGDGSGRRVPIVGVTAHALDRDRDLCLESGMDDYLAKPISPELLEAKIKRWLKPDAGASSDGLSENL